ncbi:MAG: hypothetical protein ACE5G8_06930 [Anaerolineae bacterium]
MVYWLQTRQPTLALARLLLAIVTTSALMLAGLNAIAAPGGLLLAFALWLRVGLMPFVEIPAWQDSNCLAFGEQGRGATCGEAMVWLALSTLIGVYAIARFLTMPVPAVVGGLALATMLLNGALAWLGKPGNREVRVTLLRLVATQPVLALLIAPLPATPSVALGLGYTLALGALWLTPRLGRPDFFERHWLWIYAVPLLATLSLAGFPFTLGWVAHRSIYAGLLVDNRRSELALALLAEGSAFSALVPYWRNLLSERRTMNRGLLTALPVTIPFLLPGVAGIVFTAITGLRFAGSPAQTGPAVWANLGLLWLLAAALGVGRRAVLNRLALNPGALEPFIALNWLWPFIEQAGATAGSAVLRLKAVLEGAHYLGWAFLIALAGILVVVLS